MYAIYTRQSVERDDSTSIDAQIEYCKNEIKRLTNTLGDLDEAIYKIYDDKGYSGKDTDRPKFAEMMRDIKDGKINAVVVYKLDRISRSVLNFASMWNDFTTYKVEFISCHEKFDTTTPNGLAMLQISMVFAELERATIRQRVTDIYYSRSRQGFYMGGRVPYGYDLDKTHSIDGKKTSKYIINPVEAEHIKLIYEMYANPSVSLGDIVRYLNDNNIQILRGTRWTTAKISELVRNPCFVKADVDVYNFYKSQGTNIRNDASDFIGENGCYLYNTTPGDRTNRKQFELAGRDLVIAPHEGIVSSDVWIKCRIKCMNNRQSTMTCKGSTTWLVGKLKCKKCGYALSIRKAPTKAGRYFICTSTLSAKSCKGAGILYATEVEELLLGEMKSRLKEFADLSKNGAPAVNPKINQTKVRIAQIEKDMDDWFNQVKGASGALLKRINEQMNTLDGERAALEEELFMLSYDTPIGDIDKIKDFVDKWDDIAFEDKKLVADAVIKVVHIGGGGADITWKF
jgi:DNA invertase Pin-like site-specific DNA recombinase